MSSERRVETIPASGRIVIPPNNFFFFLNSTNAINFQYKHGGTQSGANNITAGYIKKLLRDWDEGIITGTVGDIITFIDGHEEFTEDDTQFVSQIATIAGVVSVAVRLPTAITDTADVAQASGTQTVISANLLRKGLNIGVLSSALNSVRVSKSGGAGRGTEVQPGQNQDFDTTDTYTVRNDNTFGGAGAATWYATEKT